MRGKSAILSVLAGAIVIGAPFTAGCALRSEPEPDFRPPPASERRELPEDPASSGEARPAREGDGAGDPTRASAGEQQAPSAIAAQPEPEEPAGAAQPEPAVAAAAAPDSAAASCDHPFVPSRPGQWRRYVWRQSGEEQAAELRIEALRVREIDGAEREVTWRVEITPTDGGAPLAREELKTRCAPGESAEEPWFGILERSLGLVPMRGARWRWPARLRERDRFSGTASFDASEADMRAPEGVGGPRVVRVTRSHVVGVRERVEVPAGRWRAWRVDYEEEQAFGDRGERGTGTVWVAPEIGMVRSTAENSRAVVQTIELVAHGRS